MMATIAKTFTFDAAHRLEGLPADHKCHRLHGHTYVVELVVKGPVDPRTGFVVDYATIAQVWGALHDRLDHRYLNEIPGLGIPSTENLVAWIWVHLEIALPMLSKVRVKESSTTWCEMERNDFSRALALKTLEIDF